MTQEPQHELEVRGSVGAPVVLPLSNDGTTAYVWALELPPEVEPAGSRAGRLLVRADAPGSYLLVATLAEPDASTPMTVLAIRLTVA